jgi:hypothetical protein
MLCVVDPTKRGLKRTYIEPTMLDFRPGAKQACQLTTRIDGIGRDFFLGTRSHSCLHPGCSSFPLYLGTTQVSRGLALVHINYSIIYLGFETIFESLGTSPGTLTSWVGVWGEIPSYMFLQVSTCLSLFYINTTDIFEGDCAYFEPVLCVFNPCSRGVKIHKIHDFAPTPGAIISSFRALN